MKFKDWNKLKQLVKMESKTQNLLFKKNKVQVDSGKKKKEITKHR